MSIKEWAPSSRASIFKAVHCELEAMERHLRKGKDPSEWVARYIPEWAPRVIAEELANGICPEVTIKRIEDTFLMRILGELSEEPAGRKSRSVPSPAGQKRTRATIPQSVKVAVAARDRGQCRCTAYPCHGHEGRCWSTDEPEFDHVIPWSKNGADTVANLQILCGPCNRRKSASL
jgi:5-methylcytosine-specific restriction endonuclease McrA